ncbi:hypothetical protein JCM33374_g3692 [Metschnikowia sp. JCM 33374]|nr:hypothetical protein JCM33374_g3692 [Metschnikowia sp. JCM 33374]
MLPVPFYHDYAQPDMKYLGPEDPRLILVRNKDGHEEPALIYNSYHQKKASVDDDEDGVLVKEHMYFRSMWVSWGWQFQRGKFAVEDNHNPDFDNRIYNRVKELKIKNSKREKKKKESDAFRQ